MSTAKAESTLPECESVHPIRVGERDKDYRVDYWVKPLGGRFTSSQTRLLESTLRTRLEKRFKNKYGECAR